MQSGEWVAILLRFVWYTGAGVLVSSIAALAVRLWLPESSHMPLFILVHSLCIGVVLMLLIRSVDTAKTEQLDIKPLVRTKPVSSWSVSRASSGTVWHVRDNRTYGALLDHVLKVIF